MKLFYRSLFAVAILCLAAGPEVVAQEALEIKGDQDSPVSSEPTPIPERTHKRAPEPPAESATQSEAEAAPKKKAKETPSTVEEMDPAAFKKAGLDKLSPEELRTLNQWLKGYRHAAETKAAEQATEQTRESAREEATAEAKKKFNRNWLSTEQVFSRIDGEFHGLKKYTHKAIIRLEDGTVWKQANDSDNLEAKLTDHPPVMVTHSMVGYKMHVIGAGEFYVNPVRPH